MTLMVDDDVLIRQYAWQCASVLQSIARLTDEGPCVHLARRFLYEQGQDPLRHVAFARTPRPSPPPVERRREDLSDGAIRVLNSIMISNESTTGGQNIAAPDSDSEA